MNLSITQRIKIDSHISFITLEVLKYAFFFYRIFILLWIKNFLIYQKTDFCFTNAKKISITFMKTVDKIMHVRRERHEHFGKAHYNFIL